MWLRRRRGAEFREEGHFLAGVCSRKYCLVRWPSSGGFVMRNDWGIHSYVAPLMHAAAYSAYVHDQWLTHRRSE